MDYVKFNVINTSGERIEESPYLNFKKVIIKGSEALCKCSHASYSWLNYENYINKKSEKGYVCKQACYNGLIIRIFAPSKNSNTNITIEGSIGIYWSYINHKHNFIKEPDIELILQDFKKKRKSKTQPF